MLYFNLNTNHLISSFLRHLAYVLDIHNGSLSRNIVFDKGSQEWELDD